MTTTQTIRYTGTFTLDSWEQQDDDAQDGLTRGRATLTKTFSGDLVGTSRAEILLAMIEDGPSSYCGYEQVVGTVAGRTGSVLLRHAAEGSAAGAWMTWQVVAGSGRHELGGVRGEGQITRHDDGSHSYWLDLSFD